VLVAACAVPSGLSHVCRRAPTTSVVGYDLACLWHSFDGTLFN